jgi:hypothetical protein
MPRVGDLVISHNGNQVGQIVRQTDVKSHVLTDHGIVVCRTHLLTVVQPGHVEVPHTRAIQGGV